LSVSYFSAAVRRIFRRPPAAASMRFTNLLVEGGAGMGDSNWGGYADTAWD
jgi:hypothetical protein